MATKKAVDKLTTKIDGPDTRPWYKDFLVQLNAVPNVTTACAYAGVSRQAAYVARRQDEAFAEAWDSCVAKSVDALEEQAFQRAMDGSDVLMIFLLKAHKPELYRESGKFEVTGPEGGPVPIAVVDEIIRAARTIEVEPLAISEPAETD